MDMVSCGEGYRMLELRSTGFEIYRKKNKDQEENK